MKPTKNDHCIQFSYLRLHILRAILITNQQGDHGKPIASVTAALSNWRPSIRPISLAFYDDKNSRTTAKAVTTAKKPNILDISFYFFVKNPTDRFRKNTTQVFANKIKTA